jgi:hypothetical protein
LIGLGGTAGYRLQKRIPPITSRRPHYPGHQNSLHGLNVAVGNETEKGLHGPMGINCLKRSVLRLRENLDATFLNISRSEVRGVTLGEVGVQLKVPREWNGRQLVRVTPPLGQSRVQKWSGRPIR